MSGSRDKTHSKAPLVIERITVCADRLDVLVRCATRYAYTSPKIATRALSLRPRLATHACINDKGNTFGAIIAHTPMPHLLEHVAVDMLVDTFFEESRVATGVTEWISHDPPRARIQLSMTDDLIAIGVLQAALKFVNEEVIGTCHQHI